MQRRAEQHIKKFLCLHVANSFSVDFFFVLVLCISATWCHAAQSIVRDSALSEETLLSGTCVAVLQFSWPDWRQNNVLPLAPFLRGLCWVLG